MHTCIHAYMHTCKHAYMHTCIHAYMHTCIHAYMHTRIHANMHTCIHAYILCIMYYVYIGVGGMRRKPPKFAVPSGYLACSGRFRIQGRVPESEVYLPPPSAGLNLWRRPLKTSQRIEKILRKDRECFFSGRVFACFFSGRVSGRRFGVHFSWFSTYYSPIFHENQVFPT